MEQDVNLLVENFKTDLIKVINDANLPISIVYYVTKDVMMDISNSYENYLKQAKTKSSVQKDET